MLNNICLMGRMVYEPELKTTPNGKARCKECRIKVGYPA